MLRFALLQTGSIASYAYQFAGAELHWHVLGNGKSEFILTSRDTRLLESLVADMNRMRLPADPSPSGGEGDRPKAKPGR